MTQRAYNYIPDDVIKSYLPVIKNNLLLGMSIESACKKAGIHRSTVTARITIAELEDLKLIRRQIYVSITYDRAVVARIIEFYVNNTDLPMVEIARKFNTSVHTISRAVQKYFPAMGAETETITLQSKLNEENLQ